MARKRKTPTSSIIESSRAESMVFNSVFELSNWIASTPPHESFTKLVSQSANSGFSGTKDYETADNMMLTGWTGGANKVNAVMLERASQFERVKKLALDYVGAIPCVPAYLSGAPAHMVTIKQRQTKKPIITIYFNIAATYDIKQEAIMLAASTLLNVIRGLERGGVGVNLYSGMSVYSSACELVTFGVKIKNSSEPFNALNMAYPLIHPSFLRRHCFAYLERCGANHETWSGYGRPATDKETIREKLKTLKIKDAVVMSFSVIDGKSETEILQMINNNIR